MSIRHAQGADCVEDGLGEAVEEGERHGQRASPRSMYLVKTRSNKWARRGTPGPASHPTEGGWHLPDTDQEIVGLLRSPSTSVPQSPPSYLNDTLTLARYASTCPLSI